MRVRLTVMTENSVPSSELGENPEQKIRKAWDVLLACINFISEDNIYVEKVELVESEERKNDG